MENQQSKVLKIKQQMRTLTAKHFSVTIHISFSSSPALLKKISVSFREREKELGRGGREGEGEGILSRFPAETEPDVGLELRTLR